MPKLIVTLAALLILAPAVALAGGGFDQQQGQMSVPQSKIVIENHPPGDNGNGAIIAAIVAGVFALAGTVYAANRKRG